MQRCLYCYSCLSRFESVFLSFCELLLRLWYRNTTNMVRQCVVCKKKDILNPELTFHRFPLSHRRQIWLSLLSFENDEQISKTAVVCSQHFDPEDILTRSNESKYLKPGATPKPWHSIFSKTSSHRETQTKVNLCQKTHPFTSENISVKRELDDFDIRKTANEVHQDLHETSTIKSEQEDSIDSQYLISHEEVDIKSEDDVEQSDNRESQTEVNLCQKKHPFTSENISVKRELDDFDIRKTSNQVHQDLHEKSTIKSEQEDSIDSQYLISHEEVDIKSEDDVEQSDNRDSQTEVNLCQKKHRFTAESISVKRELDDFDIRKTAYEVHQDLHQKSTIKSEEEDSIDSQYLISHEEIDIKSEDEVEQSDNRVEEKKYREINQKVAAHSAKPTVEMFNLKLKLKMLLGSEQNLADKAFINKKSTSINSQNFIRHEEVDIKSKDDVEQSDTQVSTIEKKGYQQSKKRVAAHSAQPNTTDVLYTCNDCSYETACEPLFNNHVLVHGISCSYKMPVEKGFEGPIIHKCSVCPYQSIHKYSVNSHSVRHKKPDELVRYRCTERPYQTERKDIMKIKDKSLKFSLVGAAGGEKPKEVTGSEVSVKLKPKKPIIHKCSYCPYQSKHKDAVKRHSVRHKKPDELVWDRCTERPYQTERKDIMEIKDKSLKFSLVGAAGGEKPKEVTGSDVSVKLKPKKPIIYKCSYCPYHSKRKDAVKRHSVRHKKPDELVRYRCTERPYQTERKDIMKIKDKSLKFSLVGAAGDEKPKEVTGKPKDPIIHKCSVCPYQSKRKGDLKKHSVRHKKPVEIVWHRCPECPFQTKRKENLKRHAVRHNETRPFDIFKCAHCVFETPKRKNLILHLRWHRRKNICRFYCPEPECSYKTYDKIRLKYHSQVHSNDRPIKCTQCTYQSKRKASLKTHLLKHESTDKWHACPQCPYKTIRKYSLQRHVLWHAKARTELPDDTI